MPLNPLNRQLNSPRPRRRVNEAITTLRYFFFMQVFFVLLIISFSLKLEAVLSLSVVGIPAVVLSSKRLESYRLIVYFACITFVVGQRTFHLGQYIRITPCELILCVLAVLCLKKRKAVPTMVGLPLSLYALVFSSFTAIAVALANDINYNLAIALGKEIIIALPIFFLISRVIERTEHIHTIFTILSLACLLLSFLAISEYFNFWFVKYFAGYLGAPADIAQKDEEFRRLGAYFWGNPMMAGFLVLCFPLMLTHWFNAKTRIMRLMVGGSLTLTFLCIYYAGHRGVWFGLLIALCFFFYLKGARTAILLVIMLALGMKLVPEAAKHRFMSSVKQEERDSSTEKRIERAQYALSLIKKNPFYGHGWGASGLVHSDLLQIWADAGLLAITSILFLFFRVFKRLYITLKRIRAPDVKLYVCGLFASVLAYFVVLATQAAFNLPEQYPPFWTVLAIAYFFPNIIIHEVNESTKRDNDEPKNVSGLRIA